MAPNVDQHLLSLLACPATGSQLCLDGIQLSSEDNLHHYPIIKGIPWLLNNPLHSMVDWSVKLNHFNQVIQNEIRLLQNELKNAKPLVIPRLEKLIESKSLFAQSVNQLVSPILSAKVAGKPVYDALSDRAPITLNLLSYEANIYRDWVWGDEENSESLALILSQTIDIPVNKLLILGAGGCRIGYDLHMALTPELTIANDINPLLLFAAQKIIQGNGILLPEFPAQPRNAESVAVNHKILPTSTKPDNFHFVFSDASRPAIAAQAIDTLVTPWLIDVQPQELTCFAQTLNHYLPEGGSWINFGSLAFNQSKLANCYTAEEIKAVIKEAGFELEKYEQKEIPYLKSPYNAGYRMETVFAWRARKVSQVSLPPVKQNLPDWLIDTAIPIPNSQSLQAFTFNHRMYADLTARVDGRQSIQKIGKQLAKEQKMDSKEAIAMVKSFFLRIIQDNF
ncbi:Trm112 family protein [Aliikangiella sp. G2MR2-5]|uniref:Trm112 family protein n=1 Tax=Aliikangiella sp. G2MR2-5 TaxID=2788943 RepID=UPI0018AAE7B4|nr:hypothetical protein [Aliikangiella sp. G2MR2-5]